VNNVESRTVDLTGNMVRAIAKQAEAERDRRAKIIHPKPSSSPRKPLSTPPRSFQAFQPPCSCATCKHLRRSAPNRIPSWSFRCRSTSNRSSTLLRSPASRRAPMAALAFRRRKRPLWPREEDTQVMEGYRRSRRVWTAALVCTIVRPTLAHQTTLASVKTQCGHCEEFT